MDSKEKNSQSIKVYIQHPKKVYTNQNEQTCKYNDERRNIHGSEHGNKPNQNDTTVINGMRCEFYEIYNHVKSNYAIYT